MALEYTEPCYRATRAAAVLGLSDMAYRLKLRQTSDWLLKKAANMIMRANKLGGIIIERKVRTRVPGSP